jgi:riboflavin biosynthesis pyrimidine reductase
MRATPDPAERPRRDVGGLGGHDVPMRQLLPGPTVDITVDEAYGTALGSRTDGPWVGLCMVASIDGSTAVAGSSAKLSSPTDTAVLGRLRQLADVIVVGAGTVRDEEYGMPRKQGQRVGVVTQSGQLDFTTDLFRSGAGFLITTERGAPGVPDAIDVIRLGHGTIDLRAVIRELPSFVGGADYVQVEGGAALNGAMFEADLIDEINVTTSPATFGGPGPRLATGAPPHAHRFDAAQLTIDDESFVYTRWLRRRD